MEQTSDEFIEFIKEKGMENPLEEPGCPVCPGAAVRDFDKETDEEDQGTVTGQESELKQWPVQLNLLPPNASFFKDSDLLIAADCVPFAYPDFHGVLLKGKTLAVGCTKLDDIKAYREKIKAMIEMNDLNTITVAIMEVPCCYGLYRIVEDALDESGKKIMLKKVVVGINGKIK